MAEYPRILIVTQYPFSGNDGGGTSLSALFGAWPAERLAQAYGPSGVAPSWQVCRRYYRLGREEIRRYWPLSLASQHAGGAIPAPAAATAMPAPMAVRPAGGAKARLVRMAERFHLQHEVHAAVTPGLAEFVSAFRPEVLFATLGNLAHIRLVRELRRQTSAPLVLQINDDWMRDLYPGGPLRWALEGTLERELRELFSQAAVRFCICEEMAAMLLERYGQSFAPLPIPVAVAEWTRTLPVVHEPTATGYQLCYSGSIFPNAQLGTMLLCGQALALLNAQGLPVQLRVETSPSGVERFGDLLRSPHVTVAAWGDRAAQIRVLQEAHLLLIPVNFDAASLRFVQYSLPGKTSAYMATGTPLLVVGPAHVPPAAYALREGFAEVVTQPDVAAIADGIRRALCDRPRRIDFSTRAVALARERHDRPLVVEGFRQALAGAAASRGGTP